MNIDEPATTPDEEWALHAKMLELEVDDDGKQPVPLGEAMAQTLQEMHERGIITPSQIVEERDRYVEQARKEPDPEWEAEIELATRRDAEQQVDPMKALYEFLAGRTIGIALVGRAETFHWRWRGEGLDEGHEDLDPDEILTFSRLAVAAMRVNE